jgi:hypothetical protein
MMGNIGSRALLLKALCPDARIILTIRRQPEYFISVFKYFQTLRRKHLGRQLCYIENMLNIQRNTLAGSICLHHGIPCGIQTQIAYSMTPIHKRYFDRASRHFIAVDLSWLRLVDLYRQLFGDDNVLVIPQEIWSAEPYTGIRLLSDFTGETVDPPEHKLYRREHTSARNCRIFRSTEHEKAFLDFVLKVNHASNRRLARTLPYVDLDEYGYTACPDEQPCWIQYGRRGTRRLHLPDRWLQHAGQLRTRLQQHGIKTTLSRSVARHAGYARLAAKKALRRIYRIYAILSDRLRGVDFEHMESIRTLGLDASQCRQYESSKISELQKVFATIDLPEDCTAIDFGSGKGRVVWWLTKHPAIKKVIGVEISARLCLIAERNLQKLRASGYEILNTDARDVPDRVLDAGVLFYFYNPFGEQVFKKLAARIEQSLQRQPRKAWLVYFNPLHETLLRRSRLFTPAGRFSNRFSYADTVIYTAEQQAHTDSGRHIRKRQAKSHNTATAGH